MQSTHAADGLMSRAEKEVIGVGEQDLDAQILREVALGEAFHGGLGADRHEHRGIDDAVRGVETARARTGDGAFGLEFEVKGRQRTIVAEREGEEGQGKRQRAKVNKE